MPRVTGDYGLAYAYGTARVLRLADGPDEVHRNQIARLELRKYQGPASLTGDSAEVLPADPAPGFRASPAWMRSAAATRAAAKKSVVSKARSSFRDGLC